MTAITIALVDDHRVVSRSLKAYLESFPDVTVVGIAASGEEPLEHLDEWQPQVVIQDLLLAGASMAFKRLAGSSNGRPRCGSSRSPHRSTTRA